MNEEIGMLVIHHYNFNSIGNYTEMYQCSGGRHCRHNEINNIESYNVENNDFLWKRICTAEGDIKWYCPECAKNFLFEKNKENT